MKRGKSFFRKTWKILKDTEKSLKRNEPIVYSAAIAFFTIFSLPAILIVVTLVGSLFFEEEAVREEIVAQVEELINPEAAYQVNIVLENMIEIPAGFWGVLIGILVVVKSATIIFFIVQKALNSVWRVTVKPKVNYFKLLKHRLITLAMVVGLGILLASSLLLDTIIVMFSDHLFRIFDDWHRPAIWAINFIFSISVVLVVFTSMHKVLPDAKVKWKDAVAGGIITSVLFIIGKQIINLIITNIKVAGIYAAAGSLVMLLLWVFYSSVILFLGAEVTKAYANNHGRKVKPSSIAVKYEKVHEESF
jgi:membrane protein